MLSTDLIILIQKLDEEERENLGKYLASPIFNIKNRSKLIELYQIINNYISGDRQKLNDKKTIANKMGITIGSLNNRISNFYQITLEFLTLQKFMKNKKMQQYFLLDDLDSRYHPKQFIKTWKNYTDSRKEYNSINDYQINNFIDELAYNFSLKQHKGLKKVPDLLNKPEEATQHMLNNFLITFSLKILNYACQNINNKNINSAYKNENINTMLSHALQLIVDSGLINTSPINIYYYLFQLLQTNNSSYYYQIKEFLQQDQLLLSEQALEKILAYLTNVCTQKYINGQKEYLSELFFCYKVMKQRKLLNNLSPQLYKNIIKVSSELKQIEWAKDFNKEFNKNIPLPLRESLFNYNNAIILYYEKNFEEAQNALNKVIQQSFSKEEIFDKTNLKTFSIRIVYELNDTYEIKRQIDNIDGFLKRNKELKKINNYHINNYKNFISIVKKITDNKEQINESLVKKSVILRMSVAAFIRSRYKALNKIKQHINQKQPLSVSYKEWLLEKVSELENILANYQK